MYGLGMGDVLMIVGFMEFSADKCENFSWRHWKGERS